MINENIIKSVALGHAVADALGVPAEFCSREELKENPITDMVGFGTYNYPAGTWSDDTSMSLCELDVLANGSCDFDKIMLNFGEWLINGAFTAGDVTFDVGNACKNSIIDYHSHKMSYIDCGQKSEFANGNGSIMRIYPFVLYLLTKEESISKSGIDFIFTASALTHAHIRSKIACGIYACVLEAIIISPAKDSIKSGLNKAKNLLCNCEDFSHFERLFNDNFADIPEKDIKSSGYIVDTLEATLWCLLTTSDYKSCVLKAVNLGDDTDTVGAVVGALAGALYNYDSIPEEWLNTLIRKEYIEETCERFSKNCIK